MKEFKYTITDELGIHARPAGLLVKKAGEFQSKVILAMNGKEVDAKRVLGVIGLGAKKGMEVVIKADGADEDAAIKALSDFMKENL